MRTTLDCAPCFVRQALEAARRASDDPALQERVVRDVLRATADQDWQVSPPAVARDIQRRIRALTGEADPYRQAKQQWNQRALALWPELHRLVQQASDPFAAAVQLAIAGNVIDLGVNGSLGEEDLRLAIRRALDRPPPANLEDLRAAVASAEQILYLADNAGEIVLDRLLIGQLAPARVIVAVRGAPVLNDATLADAEETGLLEVCEVIDNGTDVPGTLLADCRAEFRAWFEQADLIIAKGQGNFETLQDASRPIFFLFQAKCTVVAGQLDVPIGTPLIQRTKTRRHQTHIGWGGQP